MKKFSASTLLIVLISCCTYAQQLDSASVLVKWGAESKELIDYYRFEGIQYFNISINGENLKNRSYAIIAKEYWNKKLTKSDTLVNTKRMGFKINADSLEFRLIAKKTSSDTVNTMFFLPNFGTTRKFRTTNSNFYALLDPSNGKSVKYNIHKPIALFSYTLPYEDPKLPGVLQYCELSRKGLPVEQWGEKFNIEHYIVFEMMFLK